MSCHEQESEQLDLKLWLSLALGIPLGILLFGAFFTYLLAQMLGM